MLDLLENQVTAAHAAWMAAKAAPIAGSLGTYLARVAGAAGRLADAEQVLAQYRRQADPAACAAADAQDDAAAWADYYNS